MQKNRRKCTNKPKCNTWKQYEIKEKREGKVYILPFVGNNVVINANAIIGWAVVIEDNVVVGAN